MGHGRFLYYESIFVLWAESRGYDLTYLTNVDLDRDPALLDGQKLFLSVGHDEYWSGAERSAVETAISRGVDVAFLGADALEWQIRLEGSTAGAARRTEVCYKDINSDPLRGTPLETLHWRSAALGRPENELIGGRERSQDRLRGSVPDLIESVRGQRDGLRKGRRQNGSAR
jgi:hypothetical protein